MPSNELEQMCRDHFNEPMISNLGIVRCVGYGEDERDCYIIVRVPGWRNELPHDVWHTCVGGYTFLDRLKGQGYVKAHNGEDWDDLTRLDSELTYSYAPKAAEFILKIEQPDASDELKS